MSSSSSSSSSSNSKPMLNAKRSGGGLQGLRPQPLSLPTASSASPPARPSKKPRVGDGDAGGSPGPVIIYEHTPKAVHVRPEEFRAVVQRLTGQQRSCHQHAVLPQIETAASVMMSSPAEEEIATATSHLVLALGQQEAPAPQLHNYFSVLPSPGPASDGGFLLSPGIFLFSPGTMQAIHKMIS
ncbi:hypothetical protein PR202_gb12323 [Eleusine coracana subsp. coracana]|uniref:VQ domain-containing protein n=1 Tax=Eleusine coracana subsp. coracana TaxID=191504 RepID=A0AAV5EPX7_ELECO|nr:hypothetical protein QOZ80_7BG0587390 [Eleusine coracana subsp. coracana]GJN24574.1 hypothetical protein PR202_gb12323 [Eleusine coracana subsp. coracana]